MQPLYVSFHYVFVLDPALVLILDDKNQEDVKQILVQCIGVLIQLKTQISKLVQFFGAISALVEHVIATSVHDFMMDAQNIETSMVKLGGISLGDFQRQVRG